MEHASEKYTIKLVCSKIKAKLFLGPIKLVVHLGKCLFETKIHQICVCTCLMSKPFKSNSCCVPILIIRHPIRTNRMERSILLHSEIAYTVPHMESRLYFSMFSIFLCDSLTAYIES